MDVPWAPALWRNPWTEVAQKTGMVAVVHVLDFNFFVFQILKHKFDNEHFKYLYVVSGSPNQEEERKKHLGKMLQNSKGPFAEFRVSLIFLFWGSRSFRPVGAWLQCSMSQALWASRGFPEDGRQGRLGEGTTFCQSGKCSSSLILIPTKTVPLPSHTWGLEEEILGCWEVRSVLLRLMRPAERPPLRSRKGEEENSWWTQPLTWVHCAPHLQPSVEWSGDIQNSAPQLKHLAWGCTRLSPGCLENAVTWLTELLVLGELPHCGSVASVIFKVFSQWSLTQSSFPPNNRMMAFWSSMVS